MKREWTWSITVSVKDTLLSSCFALLCYVCKEASSYKIPSTVLDWLDLSISSCFPAKKPSITTIHALFSGSMTRIIFLQENFPFLRILTKFEHTRWCRVSAFVGIRGSGDRAWSTWGVDLVGTAEGLAPLTMLLDQCLWALHLAFSFRWGHQSNSFTGSCSQFCCQMEIYHKGPFSGFLATGGRTEAIRETPDLFQLSKSCAALAPVHPSILFQLYSMDMSSTRGTMQPILHFDSEKVGTVKHRHLPLVFNLALSGQGFRQELKGELINTTVYPPLYMIFTQFPSSGVWRWKFVSW